MTFFAKRGNHQIACGYYDDGMDDLQRWDEAVREVTAKNPGAAPIDGFMYTTWQNKYDLLGAYGEKLKAAK